MFPGLSFADAMRSLVKFDGDMHRDPLTTAARMGASYGMPVTAGQHIAAQADYERTAPVVQMVEHTAQYLPNYADYQEDMIRVLGRADFVRSPTCNKICSGPIGSWRSSAQEQHKIHAQNAERSKPKPRGGLDGLFDAHCTGGHVMDRWFKPTRPEDACASLLSVMCAAYQARLRG